MYEYTMFVHKTTKKLTNIIHSTFQSDNSHTRIKRALPNGGPTWRLNLSFTEYHVYSLIEKYCRGLNFRHVLVLMNIFKDEFPDDLSILNNDILVNTLFNVSQKHIDNIRDKQEWLFKVMQTLSDGLQQGFLPSFHLPRQNLLDVYRISESQRSSTSQALMVIMKSIEAKPANLYKFVGHMEPLVKTSKTTDRSESKMQDTDQDAEQGLINEEVDRAPSITDAARGVKSGHHDHELEENREDGDVLHELERDRIRKSAERRIVFEGDSEITKPSKVGNRSDIY